MVSRTCRSRSARVRTAIATVVGVGLLATACGGSEEGGTSPADVPQQIDQGMAEAATLAGELGVDDLPTEHVGEWSVDDVEVDEAIGECLLAPSISDSTGLLAGAVSASTSTSDSRGVTAVFVSAQSETLAFASADDAAAVFATLDADRFVDCLVASSVAEYTFGEEEEEEYGDLGRPLTPAGVDVEEVEAPEAGDEATALLATFDQDTGEGDDNTDSAAFHAVRVGPVIEVIWTTRSGEAHDENPVAEVTAGIDDSLATVAARVSEALGG